MMPNRAAIGLALILATALPGLAAPTTGGDSPMTAAEFEAYATGKTLSYAQDGAVWGSEQYLPGRRVIWAFTEDDCQYGRWYEDRGHICFTYSNDPTPQCWRFYREDAGLRAEFIDDPASTILSEVRQTTEPLHCTGPEVGV